MVFIGFIKLVLLIVTVLIGLYLSVLLIRRGNAINKVWKIKEPYIRKYIEEETGQKIRETLYLNGSFEDSPPDQSITFWVAFTSDKMALIVKDATLSEQGDRIHIYRKDEVSLRKFRLNTFKMELKSAEDAQDEGIKLFVGLPSKKMEVIRHHIRKIQMTKK